MGTKFKGGRVTDRAGWVSVETMIGGAIAALIVVIFGAAIVTHGERIQPGQSQIARTHARPHQAVEFPSPAFGDDQAESESVADTTNIIHDGVTVLTPPLLVPVVNLDERLDSATSKDGKSDDSNRKYSKARKNRHYAKRSSSTRRHVEYRIVGLAAGRRIVADKR